MVGNLLYLLPIKLKAHLNTILVQGGLDENKMRKPKVEKIYPRKKKCLCCSTDKKATENEKLYAKRNVRQFRGSFLSWCFVGSLALLALEVCQATSRARKSKRPLRNSIR